ncbi:hypothetical protein SZ60_02130 [Frigoribacterium sp. MEB024]|nr:hypothetical protein SZ60_02130 [Frigoribacterium sp. MEB024]
MAGRPAARDAARLAAGQRAPGRGAPADRPRAARLADALERVDRRPAPGHGRGRRPAGTLGRLDGLAEVRRPE